jgi:hypothetical protein
MITDRESFGGVCSASKNPRYFRAPSNFILLSGGSPVDPDDQVTASDSRIIALRG